MLRMHLAAWQLATERKRRERAQSAAALVWYAQQLLRRGLLALQEAVLLRRERGHALLTARARVIAIRAHVAFNAW